ncbi:hypothetical protein HA402_010821 [Bradysia odoriphaga]|nr:hypothetical protein HA402_010821 [Bradysia odoriphaga]
MAQIEQRFNAAVNVIRGLPKSGSYQPSNDTMLRFYSYFKQATLGPCTQKQPPFWDVIGRVKYDSYKRLGNMPKDRAMELYVNELKNIMESMIHDAANSTGSVSELDGIDIVDLEVVAPELMKKVISHPNSPFASREASPIRNGYTNGDSSVPQLNGNKHFDESYQSEHSDDEYIDTVDDDSFLTSETIVPARISRPTMRRSVQQSRIETNTFQSTSYQQIEPAINQILRTVELMNNDLQQINRRIDTVERLMATMENYQLKTMPRYPRWWPFTDISPRWFIVMLLWPLLANRLGKILRKRRSN